MGKETLAGEIALGLVGGVGGQGAHDTGLGEAGKGGGVGVAGEGAGVGGDGEPGRLPSIGSQPPSDGDVPTRILPSPPSPVPRLVVLTPLPSQHVLTPLPPPTF